MFFENLHGISHEFIYLDYNNVHHEIHNITTYLAHLFITYHTRENQQQGENFHEHLYWKKLVTDDEQQLIT